MLSYFGWLALIAVTGLVLFFLSGIPMAYLMRALVTASGHFTPLSVTAASGFGLLMNSVFVWLAYRVSPALPAAAIGKRMTLGDAWFETKGHGGALLLVAVLSAVFSALLRVPTHLVLPAVAAPVLWIWTVLAMWARIMVGISLLTTIYGHYVEKRPLVTG